MTSPTNLLPTQILDFQHPRVQRVAERLGKVASRDLDLLRISHRWIVGAIDPVYDLDERQPASRTLKKRAGSCSQRFALLEALARSFRIPSRVQGLWVAGSFWYPRFGWAGCVLPERILLAWPQFRVDDKWMGVEELFAPLETLAAPSEGFSNQGETLFEAIENSAVDFEGATRDCASGRCDLSRFLAGRAGMFDCRDELFRTFGSLQDTVAGRLFALVYQDRSCFLPPIG